MKLLKSALVLITISFLSIPMFAQNINVKGTVNDQNGDPVIGAGLKVQNTSIGTITDVNGTYSISVPANAILEVSSVGFITQLVPVSGKTTLNIVLDEDVQALEATVVIGYGSARKADITGSIASVGGNELREVPAGNITQALVGRIAGVDFQSTSSEPGASSTIRIRGERSLSASNDPLIVLDGIPFMGNLNEISPNDIKSIDILKDAASTAIYGSRGANGVILIGTYKGTEGQAPRVSFNAYATVKTPIKYPYMTGQKYITLREMANEYQQSVDEDYSVTTDWQDLLYRNGIDQNYEVSVSGGTKGGSYRFGTTYYKEQATLPTKQYQRIGINGSVDQKIGKYVKVGFGTNTQFNANQGSQVATQLQMSPLVNIYDSEGNIKTRVDMPGDNGWYVWTKERVEQYTAEGKYNSESNNFSSYNNGYLQFFIPGVEGLNFKVSAALNYRRSRAGSFTGTGLSGYTDDSPNSASWSFSETFNWTVENLLSYDRTFGKHHVNAVALYSAEQSTYNGQSLSGKNIPNELFQWYNIGACLASDITVNTGSYNQSGLMSWMGRVMYTYDNRCMISAAVRSDASSRLSPGHQWHTYPAVSVGWNIHNENFMSGTRSWLDELKLRVGYGVTSNQAVSAYATLGRLSTKVYNFNDDLYATGYYVSTLPNDDLGWEYSNTWNFGIDYSFFKGRLRGTIEYYDIKTHDILLSLSLPATSGVGSTMSNIGSTQNRGIEFSINGTPIDSGDWKWDIGLNIYANRNKLIALADGSQEDKSNGWFVGYPLQCIYDYVRDEDLLWNEGDPYMDILEPSTYNAATGYKGSVGMIKVKYFGDYDENGNPTRAINSNDMKPQSAEALFMGGFNTRLSFRNWDLTVIGNFQVGGIFISSMHTGYDNLMRGRRGQIDIDYWTPEYTTGKYPRPGSTLSTDHPKYSSLMGYFNGSYLNIQTVTLGYNFQRMDWAKRAGISNLRVYATVQNLPTLFSEFSNETGLIHTGNSRSNRSSSFSTSTPQTRNYLLGVNFSF